MSVEGRNALYRGRGYDRHGVKEFVIGDVLTHYTAGTHLSGIVDVRDR